MLCPPSAAEVGPCQVLSKTEHLKKATKKIRTSFICKVIFSRHFFLYFGKGNFGGKKCTLQKSEFTLLLEKISTKIQMQPSMEFSKTDN
jgi:hypothetical protein